jgi:hypothetical protein
MSPVIAILRSADPARARDLPSRDAGWAVTAAGNPGRQLAGRGRPDAAARSAELRCRAVAAGSRWCRKGGVSAAMTRGKIHDRRKAHRG